MLAADRYEDYVAVEDRIKRDLSDAGLRMFVPRVDFQEDDEICLEIRSLQRRLRDQVCLNHYRKRKLASLVRDRLAAQEFYQLLGDVDKQIEHAFSKRARGIKKKPGKRPAATVMTPSSGSAMASPPPASTSVPLVDTRDRLLEAFADLIPSQAEFLTPPPAGPLFDEETEQRVLRFAQESGSWLPIPEHPLQHMKMLHTASHPVFPLMKPPEADDDAFCKGAEMKVDSARSSADQIVC
jgi:hypothetical protein